MPYEEDKVLDESRKDHPTIVHTPDPNAPDKVDGALTWKPTSVVAMVPSETHHGQMVPYWVDAMESGRWVKLLGEVMVQFDPDIQTDTYNELYLLKEFLRDMK